MDSTMYQKAPFCSPEMAQQGRRRRSSRTASAGPLFGPSMLSAVSLFLDSAHFTFYSYFIQSAKIS